MAKSQSEPSKKSKAKAAPDIQAESLGQCVALCQEQRWREALAAARQILDKAQELGNKDLYNSFSGARLKIEYSLRRQMAASLVNGAKQLLKEFRLDVGE